MATVDTSSLMAQWLSWKWLFLFFWRNHDSRCSRIFVNKSLAASSIGAKV